MADRKENKTTNALEKKTGAEIEEALKEDWMSKKQTIESKHFFKHKRVFLPSPVFSAQALPTNADRGTVEFNITDRYKQQIRLVSIPGNVGGIVHWFLCPGCKHRVR